MMNKRFLFSVTLCSFIMHATAQVKNNFEVIAYYAGNGRLLDSFDVNKITQIIFSFGHLKENRFHISNATDTATIQKMVSLKKINPRLTVLLSLGGWGGCKTCSDVFASAKNRRVFAKSVNEITNYFKSDGIDLDWEYPTVKGFPGHKYAPGDKKHFTKLVKKLRKVLGAHRQLSFAAGISQALLDSSIAWKKVSKKVDRINLMTYDLAGVGTPYTAHHTHLYSTQQQPVSADYAVNYLINAGVPSNKLVIGAAFYGKIWQHVPDTNSGLYQPALFRNAINYKNFASQLSEQNGFKYYWDDTAKAPYVYNAEKKLFVTYDDVRSIQLKTKYAISKKLNGIMFWELPLDTYANGLLQAIDDARKE